MVSSDRGCAPDGEFDLFRHRLYSLGILRGAQHDVHAKLGRRSNKSAVYHWRALCFPRGCASGVGRYRLAPTGTPKQWCRDCCCALGHRAFRRSLRSEPTTCLHARRPERVRRVDWGGPDRGDRKCAGLCSSPRCAGSGRKSNPRSCLRSVFLRRPPFCRGVWRRETGTSAAGGAHCSARGLGRAGGDTGCFQSASHPSTVFNSTDGIPPPAFRRRLPCCAGRLVLKPPTPAFDDRFRHERAAPNWRVRARVVRNWASARTHYADSEL